MNRNLFIGAGLVLVVGFVVAAWLYQARRAEELGFLAQENAELFVRPHSPTLGSEDAKVYVVKFTDPACETCASFSPFVKQALKTFSGKVQLVIRYAPFHAGADQIVRILEAARLQGAFWQTLDFLYERQRDWTHNHRVQMDKVWALLPETGLDVERIRADMMKPEIAAVLEQDLADGRALGVRRTPGFFVNGKGLEQFGAQQLAALIRAEVRVKYPD